MPCPDLLRTPRTLGEPEHYRLPAEKRIDGDPQQTIWLHYTDPSGVFCTGLWRSEPGRWSISYTEEEYCQLLEGHSVVTHEDGQRHELHAGDEFVIPRGFRGTWEVVTTTTKRFVIYEARSEG